MAVQTGTLDDDFFGGTPDDDEISVLAGNDSVLGDAGNDLIYGGDDDDIIDGKADNDIVYGGDGEDSVLGGGGIDSVFGGRGNDFLSGGGGDDFINGGGGTDTAFLGALDRYDFDVTFNANGRVSVLEAIDTAGTGIFGTDTIVNVELLQFGAGTDVFNMNRFFALVFDEDENFVDGFNSTQDATDNAAVGGLVRVGEISNVETVTVDKSLEFLGTRSDDELTFLGSFDLTIDGDRGDDLLFSGDGNDAVFGGAGDDSVLGNAGEDVIYGGSNADILDGKADDDWVFGGSGADTVLGGGGSDSLFGDSGRDFVSGGGGDDFLDGGRGTDTAFFGALSRYDFEATFDSRGRVTFLEAMDTASNPIFGTDTAVNFEQLQFGSSGDILNINTFFVRQFDGSTFVDGFSSIQEAVDSAVAGNTIRVGTISNSETVSVDKDLRFIGTTDDDTIEVSGSAKVTINGGKGSDDLTGGDANDRLNGGDGDDDLTGGLGRDVHKGGAGFDTFFFAEGDGGASNSAADLINDFEDGVDMIGLSGGLVFADLTISTSGSSAIVSVTASGEVLVSVKNAAGDLDVLDFI